MTSCLVLLWTYDHTHPTWPGRVEERCRCGWTTGTFTDTPGNRERLARRGRLHVAGQTAETRAAA